MHHDWIFDVLADLHEYASQNDLPGVARKVEEAMDEMQREAARQVPSADGLILRRSGRTN